MNEGNGLAEDLFLVIVIGLAVYVVASIVVALWRIRQARKLAEFEIGEPLSNVRRIR
jgi:hypothetical protein